jgi:hypothetical protein
MDEDKAKKVLIRFKDLQKISSEVLGNGGEYNGYNDIETILNQFLGVFKLSKYQVGQSCILNHTPPINHHTNWGWLSAKHFMISGAQCTIISRHFINGKFKYGVNFTEESYLDAKKNPVPILNKSAYLIPEEWMDDGE